MRKVSIEQEKEICRRYLNYESVYKIASDYGLSHFSLYNVFRRRKIHRKRRSSWNKGIATTSPRCKLCGLFLGENKEHVCRSIDLRGDRFCKHCGVKLDNNDKRERWYDYCKKCGSKRATIWEFLTRRKLVKIFGGKCQVCGFSEDACALDFHHLHGKKKNKHHCSVSEIKENLYRFVLICANHHRMVTNNVIKAPKPLFDKDTTLKISVSNKEIDREMFKWRCSLIKENHIAN